MKNTMKNVIVMCEKYKTGKITEDKFYEFLKTINIFKRLSLYKKGMLVSLAQLDLDDLTITPGDESTSAMDIEKIYLERFILSYLELDDGFYKINEDDFELMYESGLVEYILKDCQNDFDILIRMFENATKFKYLNMFVEMGNGLESGKNDENISKISKIFENKEMLGSVSEIMQYNDPSLKSLKDEIYKPMDRQKKRKK